MGINIRLSSRFIVLPSNSPIWLFFSLARSVYKQTSIFLNRMRRKKRMHTWTVELHLIIKCGFSRSFHQLNTCFVEDWKIHNFDTETREVAVCIYWILLIKARYWRIHRYGLLISSFSCTEITEMSTIFYYIFQILVKKYMEEYCLLFFELLTLVNGKLSANQSR
jgi:hypothetical protein